MGHQDNNINQIAAEAALDFRMAIRKHFAMTDKDQDELQKIIEAAIEKAIAQHHFKDRVTERHGKFLLSRAAQASEQDIEINMRPIEHKRGGQIPAAHASDEFIQCPQCGWHPVRKAAHASEDFTQAHIDGHRRDESAQASERCWTEGGTADCLIHPKTDEADWAEDYDLTSFLHGDKTHAELIEANNNLFKIARKYCLENKSLRAEIKEKTK